MDAHLFAPSDIRKDLLQFLVEEKISYDLALQRLIGLPEFPIDRLTLAYPEPVYGYRYREHIRCPIRFDASSNTLLRRDDALDLPLQGGDSETHEHCLRLLRDVFDQVQSGRTLSHHLRVLFCADLSRSVSLSEAALSQCCTGRTLNRRLAKEGTSYSDLYSAIRLEATQNLLATTHLGSGAIAASGDSSTTAPAGHSNSSGRTHWLARPASRQAHAVDLVIWSTRRRAWRHRL